MASRQSRVKDHDKGYKGLIRRVRIAAQGAHVEVGLLGEDAAKMHRPEELSADDRKEHKLLKGLAKKKGFTLTAASTNRLDDLNRRSTSSVTIGEIGEFHEFGLGNNPQRSWLRATIDLNDSKIKEARKRLYAQYIAGKITEERALELFGAFVKGLIQKRIADGIAPQVTPATQKRKGPNKTIPLINSGQFRSSINYKVEIGSP